MSRPLPDSWRSLSPLLGFVGRPLLAPTVSRASVVAVWLLLFTTAGIAVPPAAHANGRAVSFQTLEAGPYEISVGTVPSTPSVGAFHMTMTVSDSSTNTFLLDAEVTVTGVGPDGSLVEVGPLTATTNLRDPSAYETNPSVDRLGTWVFTITVAAELGEASASFDVEVREASPLVGVASILALVALLAIIGLSVRAYMRERRVEDR